MKSFKDKVAVITGAGSGMGREMALQLAREGCHLALNDVQADALNLTVTQARSSGVYVSVHLFDVTKREKLKAFTEEVMSEHGQVDILINNAGVGIGHATLEMVSEEDIDWLMGINVDAVIMGTKYFLPYLLSRPEAAIVNMSSVFGLVGYAENVLYCTSKFAVRGFSEALRDELEGTGVSVHCVHPGGVGTNIARNARHYRGDGETTQELFEKYLVKTSAEDAAKRILKGVRRKETRILVGMDAEIIDRINRLLPPGINMLALKRLERLMLGGKSLKDVS